MKSLVLERTKTLGIEDFHFGDGIAEVLGELFGQVRRGFLLAVFDAGQVAWVSADGPADLDDGLTFSFSDPAQWRFHNLPVEYLRSTHIDMGIKFAQHALRESH